MLEGGWGKNGVGPNPLHGGIIMKSWGQEFKEFILQGNVVSLAVAVIIAQAFGAVVTSLSENLIMPLIALFGGKPDFSSIAFTINKTTFGVGAFLTAVVSFLIVAAIVFFFVVKPVNALIERTRKEPPADPTLTKCPACTSEISAAATRCPFCTSEVTPSAV